MDTNKPHPHFPAEVLLNIFSHLSSHDLYSCALVNRLWSECAIETLWSLRPFPVSSTAALGALMCMPRKRQQAYLEQIRRLEFHASRDCKNHEILAGMMSDWQLPRLKVVIIKSHWDLPFEHRDAVVGMTEIEKLASSFVAGDTAEELILEEAFRGQHMAVIPELEEALDLPSNHLTTLNLVNQGTYHLAASVLEWTPRLKRFWWSAGSQRDIGAHLPCGLWSMMDNLARFTRLEVLSIDGIVEDLSIPHGDADTINAEVVYIGDIKDSSLIQAVMRRLNKHFIRKLLLEPNNSEKSLTNMLPMTLEQSDNSGESNLTEMVVAQYRFSGISDYAGKLGSIHSQQIVQFAKSHPKLRILSIGSMLGDVWLDRFNDATIHEVSKYLPLLEKLTLSTDYRRRLSFTTKSMVSLGTNCRHLRTLAFDNGLDITTQTFRVDLWAEMESQGFSQQFCLFPRLETLRLRWRGPEREEENSFRPREQRNLEDQVSDFLHMIEDHFPRLIKLSRTRPGSKLCYCRLHPDQPREDYLEPEYFLTPYYWRNLASRYI